MIAKSPNGPGWISVGEYDGTTGGMGTVGLFTSNSFFDSTTAWFVLESPDGKMQLMIFNTVSGNNYTGARLSYGKFTGTGASPTFDSSKTVEFSAGLDMVTSSINITVHMAANDEPPYDFYLTNYNRTSSVFGLFLSLIQVDSGYDSNDKYNYVLAKGQTPTYSNIGYYSTSLSAYGCLSFSSNGTVVSVPPVAYYSFGSIIFPSGGTLYDSKFYSVPLTFCSPTCYKGTSNKYFWNPSTTITECTTVYNKTLLRVNDLLVPWDGSSDPVIT
jgi:hypothetical protein